MALANFTDLKASIADWLNRADLTAVIPDFIVLAEAQLNRAFMKDGPIRQMMLRSDATVTGEFILLPSDYLGFRAFKLSGTDTGSGITELELATPEQLNTRKMNEASPSGAPEIVAVVGSEFQFFPAPASPTTYAAELTYWRSIPSLASNSTNWLLTAYPDVYLYGSLIQAAPYLKDDERIPVWAQFYIQIVGDIIAAGKVQSEAPRLYMPDRGVNLI